MAQTLDEEWTRMRGMEIQAVGIASITYDEESQNLINLRNRGAMMSDPSKMCIRDRSTAVSFISLMTQALRYTWAARTGCPGT